MSMPSSGSDARVIIKVEVNDADAQQKLTALGERMRQLDSKNKKTKRSFDDTGRSLENTAKKAGKLAKETKDADDKFNEFGRRLNQFKKDMNGASTALKSFGAAFGGVFKILKYGIMEFGLMTAALGAMKLALVAGQAVAKAWSYTVKAMGAAAGVAVAGIATVLGAIRELQVAQMKPLYTGPLNLGLDMSMLMGNKRLAMYGDSLQAIAAEQMRQTGRIDMQFQQRLTRMADFAMGDPKTLQSIAAAFAMMQKEGKVTTAVFDQLADASPALKKAFEEMAGGEKKAVNAAAKGKVTFEEFNKAVMEGNLKALQPFNGALDAINGTLVGQLKGTLTNLKEDLTQLGLGFVDLFKGPLAVAERDFETFFLKIAPTLKSVFPQLVGNIAGDADGLFGSMLDKLATSINTNMPKLVGFGESLGRSWGEFKLALRDVGDYLERMSAPFTTIYESVLRPLGQELVTTINYGLQTFGQVVMGNSGALSEMGNSIHGIFEGIRGIMDALTKFKTMIQPFVGGLLKLFSNLGMLFGSNTLLAPLLKFVTVLGIMFMLFKKFIMSLGMVKKNNEQFRQTLLNLVRGKQQDTAATEATTAATQQMGAAANQTTAQIQKMVVALTELLYIQRQLAGVPAGASMTGMGFAMPGALQQKLNQQSGAALRNGTAWSVNGWDPKDPNAQRAFGNVLGVFAPAKQGEQQAKGFKAGLSKYKVGASLAGGMAASLLGNYISGVSAPTNKVGQAAGGALSMGATGAMMGMAFGPWGAAIGGGAGLLIGGIGGWLGAGKEQERLRQQGRDYAGQRVAEALGTGNRMSDYTNAQAAIQEGYKDIEFLNGGARSKISGIEQRRSAAVSQLWDDFSSFATRELINQGKLQEGERLRYVAKDGIIGTASDGTTIRNGARDGFTIYGGARGGKQFGDMEADPIEQLAVKYAMQRFGLTQDEAEARTNGRGDGKNAFFLKDIVEGRYNDEIAHTNKQLEELKEKYGSAALAGDKYKEELKRIAKEQTAFTKNMDDAVDGLGLNSDEVSALFDELGLSLAKSGVGIHEFNKLIGYTGDKAADAATAMGRLRDVLLGGVDQSKQQAETAERLRGQLTAYFETRGTPMSKNDATIMGADTMSALVDNQLLALQTGQMSFKEMFGPGSVVTSGMSMGEAARAGMDTKGTFQRQMEAFIAQSEAAGVPPELLAVVKSQYADMLDRVDLARTDPFERAKIDSTFASEFTTQMDLASRSALADIEGGSSASAALDTAAAGLTTFLEDNGIKVTPETLELISSTLGNTVLNSSMSIEAAFRDGAELAYDRIRAAMSGAPEPGNGGKAYVRREDTASPRASRFGDSSSARFRRSMGAHAALNSRYGGRRTVTSGIRNFALGSINSDHTTGAAFDLTGDNLLAYGKDMRDAGGFAEMHGGPANRHLHVVPNIGDSASPAPAGSRGGSAPAVAASSGTTIINVYGSEGQSVQALADEVMDRLDRRERNMRERS